MRVMRMREEKQITKTKTGVYSLKFYINSICGLHNPVAFLERPELFIIEPVMRRNRCFLLTDKKQY